MQAPARGAWLSDFAFRALWGRGFRPFFLLAAAQAVFFVPAWLAVFAGWIAAPAWGTPVLWHGHEMLFGFVGAAIAGFLLTSVPVWTGASAVAGARLAALAGLWVAGRLALLGAGWLAPLLVAAIDLAFFVALAVTLTPVLLAARQRRNYGFLVILWGMALANLLMHLAGLGLFERGAALGLRLGVDLVALLVVIVGGRITPSFTGNALRRAGVEAEIRVRPWADRSAPVAIGLLGVTDLVAPHSVASGVLASLAALLVLARLSGWQSFHTSSDPLLWSLHLGYLWAAVGLACVGAADLGMGIPVTAGLHALTAGAFGATILAVMTRVGLGHTGRELVAPRGVPLAYLLVNAGALLRVLGPILFPAQGLELLVLSGLLWSAAFGIFAWLYAPILTRPRVDGKPG